MHCIPCRHSPQPVQRDSYPCRRSIWKAWRRETERVAAAGEQQRANGQAATSVQTPCASWHPASELPFPPVFSLAPRLTDPPWR